MEAQDYFPQVTFSVQGETEVEQEVYSNICIVCLISDISSLLLQF